MKDLNPKTKPIQTSKEKKHLRKKKILQSYKTKTSKLVNLVYSNLGFQLHHSSKNFKEKQNEKQKLAKKITLFFFSFPQQRKAADNVLYYGLQFRRDKRFKGYKFSGNGGTLRAKFLSFHVMLRVFFLIFFFNFELSFKVKEEE